MRPSRGQRWIDWGIELPSVIGMFLMMFHISVNALLRTMGGEQIPYTLEIVQYWYVPVVALLGFVAAQHRRQHLSGEFIFDLLPEVTKKYVDAAGRMLGTIVSAGFAWFGFVQAARFQSLELTAGSSPIPSWPVYYISAAIFTLLAVQLGFAVIEALLGKTPPPVAEEAAWDDLMEEKGLTL